MFCYYLKKLLHLEQQPIVLISFANSNIIAGLRRGDEGIFDMLFKNYFSRLTYFAREFVIDEEVAKNLVQDTFVTLWSKRENLAEEVNINAWLYSTVKFHCMNHLRTLKVSDKYNERVKISQTQAELNYYSLSELDTTDLTFNEIQYIIDRTLESLPEQSRKVFCLSRFEQKKNREIAEELDISIKTVEAHMSKGLKAMRVALKDYLPLVLPFI
ncbi:RNA polymerase sigma-70 factor [Puteibacter caeruleilacunae]|nr:RNA polymerase sigma-70 factor [Puteibacter caeruleilacunae]